MRGEWGEFNSWQCPMGEAAAQSLALMGLTIYRCDRDQEVKANVEAALYAAYSSDQQIAVLLGQKLIGRKEW